MSKDPYKNLGTFMSAFTKKTEGSYVEEKDLPTIKYQGSTGSLNFDLAFGGGTPAGKIFSLVGEMETGKSLMATLMAVEIQKQGKIVLYLDSERKFDAEWARHWGLDTSSEKFMLLNPESAEDAFDNAIFAVKSGFIGLVVLDSLAHQRTQAEMEGNIGDSKMGKHPVTVTKFMYQLSPYAADTGTSICIINQRRDKLGILHGDTLSIPGGHSYLHSNSYIFVMRKAKKEKDGSGITVRFRVLKAARSFSKEGEVYLNFNTGKPDLIRELLGSEDIQGVAKVLGVIETSGANYFYNGDKIAYGRKNFIEIVNDNPELLESIHKDTLEAMRTSVPYGIVDEEELNQLEEGNTED